MKYCFIVLCCLLSFGQLVGQEKSAKEESKIEKRDKREEKKIQAAQKRLERRVIRYQSQQDQLYFGSNRSRQEPTMFIGLTKNDSIKIMDLEYKKYNTIANLSFGIGISSLIVYRIADEISNSDGGFITVIEQRDKNNEVLEGLTLGIGTAALISGIFFKVKALRRLRSRLAISTNGRSVGVGMKF